MCTAGRGLGDPCGVFAPRLAPGRAICAHLRHLRGIGATLGAGSRLAVSPGPAQRASPMLGGHDRPPTPQRGVFDPDIGSNPCVFSDAQRERRSYPARLFSDPFPLMARAGSPLTTPHTPVLPEPSRTCSGT